MRSMQLAILMFVVTPVDGKDVPPPAEPSVAPDWSKVRQAAEADIRRDLYDPNAATFRWTSGFSWDYTRDGFAKKKWGWIACLEMNAKNRLGGYVGETRHMIRVAEDGSVTAKIDIVESKCGIPSRLTPLQAALITPSATPGSSVAEQLEKLATLLEKGLITRNEFDAQKARLIDTATH